MWAAITAIDRISSSREVGRPLTRLSVRSSTAGLLTFKNLNKMLIFFTTMTPIHIRPRQLAYRNLWTQYGWLSRCRPRSAWQLHWLRCSQWHVIHGCQTDHFSSAFPDKWSRYKWHLWVTRNICCIHYVPNPYLWTRPQLSFLRRLLLKAYPFSWHAATMAFVTNLISLCSVKLLMTLMLNNLPFNFNEAKCVFKNCSSQRSLRISC